MSSRDWNEAIRRIFALQNQLRCRFDAVLRKEIGLSSNEHEVLLTAGSKARVARPWTRAELARETGIPNKTVDSIVDRLLEGGFVEVSPVNEWSNRKQIVATEKGRAIARAGRSAREYALQELQPFLSEDPLTSLHEACSELRRALEALAAQEHRIKYENSLKEETRAVLQKAERLAKSRTRKSN